MIGLIKKYWHDPVWSKVIASSITGAAGVCIYFFDWWPIIKSVSGTAANLVFFTSTEIPNWLLGILAFPLLLGLFGIGIAVRNKLLPNRRLPDWHRYLEDKFFDIRWTWRYDEKNKIVDLFSFCPSCGFQIYPRPHSDWMVGFIHTKFHCENCGQDFKPHPEQIPQLENKIIRHIQLKIRNNTWKTQNDRSHQN